jgi:DNA processing protein
VLGVSAAGPVGVGTDGAMPAPTSGGPAATWQMSADERSAWAVLAAAEGLGPVGFNALLRRFGSGLAILAEAGMAGGLARIAETPTHEPMAGTQPRRLGSVVASSVVAGAQRMTETLARIEGLGVQVLTAVDPAYPRRLAAIEMPPHVLFVLGDPVVLDARSTVAVVGTRRATDGGRAFAARLAAGLVAAGSTTVSGLATGIDGAAQAATVHAHGTTIAVIGSGHATLFPRSHRGLADRIVSSGGAIVSELAPDVMPTRGTFPRRNRVISGLADATVVVEAPARSGALITASWALEQGRECFLVPGPLDAPASAGCLAFLREFAGSARIVTSIPQLLDDLGLADHLTVPGVPSQAAAALVEVGAAGGRIGRELVLGRATVDELVAVTGWPVASVLATLTLLERRGLAVGIHGRFRPAGALAAADPAFIQSWSSARI